MATIQEQKALVQKLKAEWALRQPLLSISKIQSAYRKPAPATGNIWISQDVFKNLGNSELETAVYKVIQELNPPESSLPGREFCTFEDLRVEWISQQKPIASADRSAKHTGEQIYKRICQDVEHDMVIIYAHGGAFYAGSPGFARPITTKLAKLTKARVVAVQYRLAPPNQFPAALLDMLTAFLSLVYPGPDAKHKAVLSSSIVFAGDSSGGNLCLSVLQLILQLRVSNATIKLGQHIFKIPLPAGVTALSPFCDLTFSLPSCKKNDHIDMIRNMPSLLLPNQPVDDIWPSKPPRGDHYCESSTLIHPLVCPCLAQDWTGAPPIWIAVGEERCADSVKLIASQAAKQDVSVIYTEYEGLPHIFPMMLKSLPQSQQCYTHWAETCLNFVDQGKQFSTSKGLRIPMPGKKWEELDVTTITNLTHEEALELITAAAAKRKPWTGMSNEKL